MNIQTRPAGHQAWEQVRSRLDQNAPFSNMYDTPYYRDAVYDHYSKAEYARRYAALRDKMREHKLDCVIVPGGPSHWSFGGGMQWLTGHWEWHAIASYVVVPLDGEPTLVFSMGGTHAEACRRECANALTDVRHSRSGKYAEVMVERIKELKLEHGRIGLIEVDPRHNDYLPVNQYNVLRQSLPDAELVFTKGFMHELVVVHSEEELACVRKAGLLCQRAMEAMVARAKPGVPEYELRAAAGDAILDGGGDIDFLIIGSTPMADPALVFGNPRPSQRKLKKGDIINWSSPPATTACRRRSARRSRSGRRPTWCASSGTRSRCPATRRSSPRSNRAMPRTMCGSPASSSATRACSHGPRRCTASTSSPTSRTSSPSAPRPTRSTRCSSPA
jgi:Xaa-Pro dipeptidase